MKQFQPGDVRACGARACIAIDSQPVLDALAAFYYGPRAPVSAAAPKRRSPYLRLVFANDYVTGVVAGSHFDRFLSFGVNLQQFRGRVWYAVPASVAAELRVLAPSLSPGLLPGNVLLRSH